MTKSVLFLFLLLAGFPVLRAQDKQGEAQADALPGDIGKVEAYIQLAHASANHNFSQSVRCANKAMELARTLGYTRGEDDAYNALADAYWYHGSYEKAQSYYFQSYKLNDSIHNDRGIAYALYNIGWIVCIQQHNFAEESRLYKALAIYTRLRDTIGQLRCYNALGSYYSDRYHMSKLRPFFDSSLRYFNLGIKGTGQLKLHSRKGNFISNLADLYAHAGDYATAMAYNDEGIRIHASINDTSTLMMNYNNKGNYLNLLKRYREAEPLFREVSDYCVHHGLPDLRANALLGLAEATYGMGSYKEAYGHYKAYSDLKDTLNKETYSTSLQEMQGLYELSQAENKVKEFKMQSEMDMMKSKTRGYIIYALIGVALIVLVVAILLFRQNRQKQLTNTLLREQNTIIAEKKLEIENSIQYAKGIQHAFLPPLADLKVVFPQSFVFYRPKDVVSGDFYWFQRSGDYFWCMVADCTGHGVPGAFMSIIGMDKIVQAIFEKELQEPSEILAFLNREIKSALKQHNDEARQKDGMDLVLLRFHLPTHTATYAGANRPLFLLRQGELQEYKPDKVAIGGFTPIDQAYASTRIELQKGDSLFLCTDGYADQFGGRDGKKFMTRNLKDLMTRIATLDAGSQQDQLQQAFDSWKGNYEQVDDVLVLGIIVD